VLAMTRIHHEDLAETQQSEEAIGWTIRYRGTRHLEDHP